MVTNVKSKQLNYNKYSMKKYDDDIVRSIPGHKEFHKKIEQIVRNKLRDGVSILELGIGTGLTSEMILRLVKCDYVGVDFSENMLKGAKKRLNKYSVKLIKADFSKYVFPKNIGAVVSVIGLHHQKTDRDKKNLFKKIFKCLNEGGIFIFGDLLTFRDKHKAALNEALHFHRLVENAMNKKSLIEWAYHHKFLNNLAPIEDQVEWLKEVGFSKVEIIYTKFNTALICAER